MLVYSLLLIFLTQGSFALASSFCLELAPSAQPSAMTHAHCDDNKQAGGRHEMPNHKTPNHIGMDFPCVFQCAISNHAVNDFLNDFAHALPGSLVAIASLKSVPIKRSLPPLYRPPAFS